MSFTGELAALGAALCWAMGASFFIAAGRRMGSLVLNRLRLTVAAVFLGSALWALRGAPWPLWATAPQVQLLAASSLLGFVFGDSFYFRALLILGAGRATLIASTSPVFTAIIARVLTGERLGAQALIGMFVVLAGLVIVLQGQVKTEHRHPEGSAAMGVLSGFLAAIGQAAGYVLSKMALTTGIDALSATVVRVATAVVAVWLLAPFQGGYRKSLAALRDPVAARAMAGGAFVGPFLGVTLSLLALQHTQAAVAASITACYPLFAMIIASRVHHERVTARTLTGALVTIAGVVLLFLRAR